MPRYFYVIPMEILWSTYGRPMEYLWSSTGATGEQVAIPWLAGGLQLATKWLPKQKRHGLEKPVPLVGLGYETV